MKSLKSCFKSLSKNQLARDLAEIFSALLTFFLLLYFEVVIWGADKLVKWIMGV